jgi:homoserine dehydrogenase
MTKPRIVRVAMAGCGTVGSGVAEIVLNRADDLAARTNLRFEFTRVLVSNPNKPRPAAIAANLVTTDPAEFAKADADMVVEVMGGTTNARDVVLNALKRGRPVVTANKALLALHGVEIFKTAREKGTCVAFEASCLGGLPVITTLLRGLQANRIDSLWGMFNSTCNFVLTQMMQQGKSFADAIRLAQELGYAEANPTLDIDGSDTAHKLVILASLAFGKRLSFDEVAREGIEKITLADLQFADQLGYAIKLLGVGRQVDGAVNLQVRPTLIAKSNPLSLLHGTYSAMVVRGDALGDTIYAGGGAGSLPTASGVVADMIEVAAGSAAPTFNTVQAYFDQTTVPQYADANELDDAFGVRFEVDHPAKAAPGIERALHAAGIPLRHMQIAEPLRTVMVYAAPTSHARLRTAVAAVALAVRLAAPPVILHVLPEGGVD